MDVTKEYQWETMEFFDGDILDFLPLTESKNVKDRWNGTIKVMLLEEDQDTIERYLNVHSLLELILHKDVMDTKWIRWKDIANNFPKCSSSLNQDFWNLIRRKKVKLRKHWLAAT